jgi:hypothetical protein
MTDFDFHCLPHPTYSVPGKYDELFTRIADAQELMLKKMIEANTVVINGKKYGELCSELQRIWACGYLTTPSIFGMAAVPEMQLPNDYDFVVQHRMDPPLSRLDTVLAENKRLKETLDKLRQTLEVTV